MFSQLHYYEKRYKSRTSLVKKSRQMSRKMSRQKVSSYAEEDAAGAVITSFAELVEAIPAETKHFARHLTSLFDETSARLAPLLVVKT